MWVLGTLLPSTRQSLFSLLVDFDHRGTVWRRLEKWNWKKGDIKLLMNNNEVQIQRALSHSDWLKGVWSTVGYHLWHIDATSPQFSSGRKGEQNPPAAREVTRGGKSQWKTRAQLSPRKMKNYLWSISGMKNWSFLFKFEWESRDFLKPNLN